MVPEPSNMAQLTWHGRSGFHRHAFWILLPTLVLATAGFYFLRKDRQLAELDGTREARRVAQTLVREILPGALQALPPDASRFTAFQRGEGRPEEDPCAVVEAPGPNWIRVGPAGDPVFPPRPRMIPPPPVRDREELSLELRRAWRRVSEAAFANGEPNEAGLRVALESFLKMDPPGDHRTRALAELGHLLCRTGEVKAGLECLETVLQDESDARGQSGFPLAVFARLRWLEHDPSAAMLHALCAEAVLSPGGLTQTLLAEAERREEGNPELPGITRAWREVLERHQTLRRLAWQRVPAQMNGEGGSGLWLATEATDAGAGEEPQGWWWVRPQTTRENETWLEAWPEAALRERVGAVVQRQSLPAYFDLRVDLDGRMLTGSDPSTGNVLVRLPGDGALSGLRLAVVLTRPDLLYGRARGRAWWLGGLLALALSAVAGGLWSADRAFRRQAQLGAMKDNFVSSVSHELRTPIASVRLMAEELMDQDGDPDPEKNAEYHRYIIQECRRLGGLIENVLDFSRIEQGRKEYHFDPVDLTAVAARTVALMKPVAEERGVRLRLKNPSTEPVEVDGDAEALQQVLVNLIDNAVKHSPDGGEVRVEVRRRAEDRAQMAVTDQGPGIPREDRLRIFERFYRRGSERHRETRGVGLGLAIVRHVVTAHHGRIRVGSGPGHRGSVFLVELPGRQDGITGMLPPGLPEELAAEIDTELITDHEPEFD